MSVKQWSNMVKEIQKTYVLPLLQDAIKYSSSFLNAITQLLSKIQPNWHESNKFRYNQLNKI